MMKLWAHQEKAVNMAKTMDNMAIFMDTGVGKSLTIIRILEEDYAKGGMRPTLIFCPLSVCKQWKQEFLKYSAIHESKILVLTGSGKKREDLLRAQMKHSTPCIVVTNYEAITIQSFYETLMAWSPEILVCDESQKLKNHASRRTKKIYPLAKLAKRRFLLSGTPVLNNLMDVFGQFKILDDNVFGKNFVSFRLNYFYDANASWKTRHAYFPNWQPRPEAAQKIGSLIGGISLQAKKEECIDLPPLHRITLPVEMTTEQRKVYNQMEKFFIAELKGQTMIAPIAMVKILRLQQIVSGFIQPEGKEPTWFNNVPRLSALQELLESLGQEKTIIWTVFKPTYEKIGNICAEAGRQAEYLTGEQSAFEKDEAIENFRYGKTDTLIAHPCVGGVGVSLTEAKYAIYYSKNYSLEQFVQSEARNYRGGSFEIHDKVCQYHLSTPNSIDEIITKALIEKRNIADMVLSWANNTLDTAVGI